MCTSFARLSLVQVPVVGLGTTVLEGGKILAEAAEVTEVKRGEGKPVAVRALGKNRPPRLYAQRQQPIKLREAHVVAHREPKRRSTHLRRYDLRSRRDGPALQILRVRSLYVEEMDLALHIRYLPIRPEQRRCIMQFWR